MLNLIALIVFILSLIGIGIIVYRKIPLLKNIPKTKVVSCRWFEKIFFDINIFLQKILSKIKILTLKIENKISLILQKLREYSKKKKIEKK